MGDNGGIALFGWIFIIGIFVFTPILLLLFIVSLKAPLGRARPFVATIIGIILLPFIFGTCAFAYILGKASLESYLNSRKNPDDWKHRFDMDGIHYEVAQQRSTSLMKLPDGTHIFEGDPIKFTEKDGLLTINDKFTLRVKEGDTIEVYRDGTAATKKSK